MTYHILFLCHSGPGLIGDTNSTSQYGCPMVATTAISGGHFVCFDAAMGRLSSAGLSLSFTSPKPFRVATGARTQGGVHGQSAQAAHCGSPGSLPPMAAADQPGGGRSFRAVAQTKLSPWLRARSVGSINASSNTIRIVTPRPSWLKFTSYWPWLKRTTPNY
jgi:hypothetical protein